MYRCPSCEENAIPVSRKLLTGPLVHYHCPKCGASLSSSWAIIYFLCIYAALQILALIYWPIGVRIGICAFGAIFCAVYWVWFSKPVIANKSSQALNDSTQL